MNTPHFALVAYAHDGLRLALNVVEVLEPIAEVQLCSYHQSKDRLPQEPDVALCIVTDDESIDMAHEFQASLGVVPTFVVDHSGGRRIEANGFAGKVSASPEQVLKTVRQLLAANGKRDFHGTQKKESGRAPRRLTSPFDHTLTRTAGAGQTPKAILMAAARQLAWDLRAERSEAFLHCAETRTFQKVYAEPETGEAKESEPSPEIIRLIKKRFYPSTLMELESRPFRPLHQYLASRNLNLLVPLVKETLLLGWLTFSLEAERCTDDFLDDLQVAAHLLMISLGEAYHRVEAKQDAVKLDDAFSALKSGILVIDAEGQINGIAGATALLGSQPQKGESFKSIHNSRVREVIAHALRNNFIEKSWVDFSSRETIVSYSTRLADGKIVVFWGPRQSELPSAKPSGAPSFNLKEVIESLPVPVLLDAGGSPGATTLPEGRISDQDGEAIRACALQAEAKNVKALHLRLGKDRSPVHAVLFYETAAGEANSDFADNINQAVQFSVVTA